MKSKVFDIILIQMEPDAIKYNLSKTNLIQKINSFMNNFTLPDD